MADVSQTRTNLLRRWTGLESERASWIGQWAEISRYLLPYNGRYFLEDRDRGTKKFNQIYDNTGTVALRTLAAGLMSGATSPARPWFRLQTPDPALNAYQPVKVWLDQTSQRMHQVFQSSNTYRALHQIYTEMGAFGTGAGVILPDFNNVIHWYPLTAGEYCIATDAKGKVVTLYRRFQMQVSQLVKEFGYANCSMAVQAMYDAGTLDAWVTVQHSIEPRSDRDPSKKDARNMAWGSWYMELTGEEKFLREGGFKRFPVVAPRWAVAAGDIYGNSPGMEALGDVKQLQHEQLRKAQGIDQQTNPALAVPTSLKNREIDRFPGGVTYYDTTTTNPATVKNLVEVNFELQYLLADIQDVRTRINATFFKDLFLMISEQPENDSRMTATEVAARQEEKMLMIGPVLERLSNELLEPLIDITFDAMMEGGALPPPPQEMQGVTLSVELVSVLAQAQRAINTNSTDRFVASMTAVAQVKPDVLDKFNADAWADSYGDQLGIDPTLIVADDQVQQIRDARAKAQAAQAQAAIAEQNSKTAKNLGQTPTSGPPNAAMDMMQQFSGYGGGQSGYGQ